MTLQSALMTAIATLVSVVLFLAGLIGYLWRELRAQYRERAKDSALFLHTLEQSPLKYSARAPGPQDRHTPSETPLADHQQPVAGYYGMRSTKTSPTRR